MTPEEAISLLKNPQVIQQLVELTRDPNLVKRLSDIAAGGVSVPRCRTESPASAQYFCA